MRRGTTRVVAVVGHILVVAAMTNLATADAAAARAPTAPTAPVATARPVVATTLANAAKWTIRIGVLGSETGAGGPTRPEARQIGKAWADLTNATGGSGGYRVEVVYRDVAGDPAKALKAVRELDKAGVVAITQSDASILGAVRDAVRDRGLPVVGGAPEADEFDWHPMFFPVQAGFVAGAYGRVAAAHHAGATHLRILACDAEPCAATLAAARNAAAREGIRLSIERVPRNAADYSAACTSARNAAVDFLELDGVQWSAVLRDCARMGFHPAYDVAGVAGPTLAAAAKGETVVGALTEFGAFYDGPETARFRQALARTGQRVADGTATQTSVRVWLGLEMIGAIAKRMTVPAPQRRDFLYAAYTVKGETLGGQIAPQDYTMQRPGTGSHAAGDCWTQHVLRDGRMRHTGPAGEPVERLTFVCGTGLTYSDGIPPH